MKPKLTIENETILWMLYEQDAIGIGGLTLMLGLDHIEVMQRYQDYFSLYGSAVEQRRREMEAQIMEWKAQKA